MLSAQTTDIKVNLCTPSLFAAAPDAAAVASLGAAGIEPHIRSLGLAPTKARHVASTAAALVAHHAGAVPLGWEALQALPGVGRKTASVVRAMAGADDAFAVDTHIHRRAARWGLSAPGASVEQTEADCKAAFAAHRSDWAALHVRIILFGREHCPARGHEPRACPICSWVGK
jgi:endonuclease-3